MVKTILDCFPNLLKDDQKERIKGGSNLIKHLSEQILEFGNEGNKELNHALTRLIRGIGSSKISARKGFYATLTVYLKLNPTIKFEDVFKIMDNELKPSGSNDKSENADIHNGRILVCGALIRSKIVKNLPQEDQIKVLECLTNSGKKRSYLIYLYISYVLEFLNQFQRVDEISHLLPILETEFCKPLSEHNLDSFYGLLVIQEKFPGLLTKKLKKKFLGSENIISDKTILEVLRILTDIPRLVSRQHPVFEVFCKHLITTKYVEEFWLAIDERFSRPRKTDEFVGTIMFKLILQNLQTKSSILTLLSQRFLRYMLNRFLVSSKHKSDEILASFKASLSLIPKNLSKDESNLSFQILQKLILFPGELLIEKSTGTKIIQMIIDNLNSESIKKLSKLYIQIANNTKFKEKAGSITEPWTNVERTYAAHLLSIKLLGHPEMLVDHDWRNKQLQFLFQIGLCEASNVGVELAPHFKESFYRALDHKLPTLQDLKTILTALINYINEEVFSSLHLKLRTPLTDELRESWTKMLNLERKLEKNSELNKNLNLVFHIINLQMGLQLFSDCETASSTVNEIFSCVDHIMKSKSLRVNEVKKEDKEPEWVEVIVDLLLSLLSRQSHLFRTLVKCVFPHVCPYLTPSAVHQILNVLDVKSNNNPLSFLNEDEESESDMDIDEDNENADSENESSKMKQYGNVTSEDEYEESDSEIEESDNEDETVTDRLRLAISQALGDASMQTDDEDVDVDQIGEQEGKRLDESLAAAFRILKENRRHKQSKKQEKKAQVLTHFRIRVIDLLELFIDSNPPMSLTLDILVPLYFLLEFSIKDQHQKPLQHRVRSCLKKLSSIKKFKDVENVNSDIIMTILKTLVEKGEKSVSVCQEMGDKLAECCVFLVRCIQQSNVEPDDFINFFVENMTSFFKKRDCILSLILFKKLLQLQWEGNWELVQLLVDFAFDPSIRSFRRGQALDLLKTFYNNSRLICCCEYEKIRNQIEKKLCQSSTNFLLELKNNGNSSEALSSKNIFVSGKIVKQKYICLLFGLLTTVNMNHIHGAWDWTKIAEAMVEYRSLTCLSKDTKTAYNKLAARIGAKTFFNQRNTQADTLKVVNYKGIKESLDENCIKQNRDYLSNIKKSPENPKKQKKKGNQKDKQKLKKQARELRVKKMSEGLEDLSFNNINFGNELELHTNGSNDKEKSNEDFNTKSNLREVKIKWHNNISTADSIPHKKKKKVETE